MTDRNKISFAYEQMGFAECDAFANQLSGARYDEQSVAILFDLRSLVAVPGVGVTEGTLYPLLSRLRLQGLIESRLVESSGGPARKYYRLTSSGRTMVGLMNRYYDDMLSGLKSLRSWGNES